MTARIALLASCVLCVSLPALADDMAPAAEPATQPTTGPATRPTLEMERAEWHGMVKDEQAEMPRLADMPKAKLLTIELDGGHLHVKPQLQPTEGMSKFTLTDWPGYANAMVGPAESLTFNFIHTDLAWRDAVVMRTTVMTNPDYLQIARDIGWQGDERMLSVQLIQSRQFADEDGNPIRLLIQYNEIGDENEGGKSPVNQNRAIPAPSFEQLRLAHPSEVRAYLLPILRDLGAAGLVKSTDPKAVWQVLGGSIASDPKIQEKIDALLKQIATGDFKTRMAAEDTLLNLGPEAAATIARMDLSKLDPDTRVSAESAIKQWQSLPAAQVKQMAGDVNFLIDAAELDADPRLTTIAIEQLKKMTGKPIDLPSNLSPAQREERLEALRPPPTTQPIFDDRSRLLPTDD